MNSLLVIGVACWVVAAINAVLGNWTAFAVCALGAVMVVLICIHQSLRDIASSKTHITFHPKPKAYDET